MKNTFLKGCVFGIAVAFCSLCRGSCGSADNAVIQGCGSIPCFSYPDVKGFMLKIPNTLCSSVRECIYKCEKLKFYMNEWLRRPEKAL